MSFEDYHKNYDPELYDTECEHMGMNDIELIRKLCAEYGGPVLEICSGTGRIAIPLAHDGFNVTGLDLSRGMLQRCEEKLSVAPEEVRKRVTIVKGDMRKFDLGKKFRTVIIGFNSFLGLETRQDQIASLNRVREHMQKSKGYFFLDVFNPRIDMLDRDPRQPYREHLFEDENTGITHELLTSIAYDTATQVSTILLTRTHSLPDGTMKRDVQELKMRMIFPEEMLLLLEHCGFKIVERWGNYEMDELVSGSPKQLIVARLR